MAPLDPLAARGGEIADQAQQTATYIANRAGDVIGSRLEAQKDRAVDGLESVANALRQTSQNIARDDAIGIHQYVDAAAVQVERFSGYLDANDLGALIDDVEEIARRQPVLFFSGAFVLGLLGARFLKSSRPRPENRRRQGYGTPAPQATPDRAAPQPNIPNRMTPNVPYGGGREGH